MNQQRRTALINFLTETEFVPLDYKGEVPIVNSCEYSNCKEPVVSTIIRKWVKQEDKKFMGLCSCHAGDKIEGFENPHYKVVKYESR